MMKSTEAMGNTTGAKWLALGGTLLLSLFAGGCSSFWSSGADKSQPVELGAVENSLPVRTLWRKSIGKVASDERLKLIPAFSGNVLFTADHGGRVEAHDALTGKTLWVQETGVTLSGGPGVGDGLVLVGSPEAELIALDERTGKQRWRTRLSSEMLSVPRANLGVAVAYTIDGRLHGRSSEDGRLLWAYDRPTPALTLHGSSSPIIYEEKVICGFANGKLAALNIITGEPLWEVSVSLPSGRTDLERMVDINGDPVVKDGVVFVATYQGDLAAIAAESGTVFWRKQLSSHSGVDVNWRMVFATDEEDNVWAVDPRSGAAVWKNKGFGNRKLTGPVVFDDYLLVGDLEGYVHWIAQEDGHVLARQRIGSDPISAKPLVRGKVAFVLGDGGDLVALTLEPPRRSDAL